MDDNTRSVLIALVTVAGGLLTALFVTRMTVASSDRIERDKWKRELYAGLHFDASELRDAIHELVNGAAPDDGWGDHIAEGQRKFSEIKIIAPQMIGPTGDLWDAWGALMKGVLQVDVKTGAMQVMTAQYEALDESFRLKSEAFLAAAQRDLEVRRVWPPFPRRKVRT